jgi:DNA-binding NtrC family response regulator
MALKTILAVDDTPANLAILADLLEPHGYSVSAVPSGQAALSVAARLQPEVILLDIMMPEMDGLETCRRLKADPLSSHIPVIFVSARDDVAALVEGFRVGGCDYISKPFQPEEVLTRVQNHVQLAQLTRDLREKNQTLEARAAELTALNDKLQTEIDTRKKTEEALSVADSKLSLLSQREAQHWGVDGFVGRTKTISKILTDIRRLQNFSTVNVLITGESGTGKELVARAIHFGSPRAKGPFVPVNCVAIPEDLAESMLFGHVRGAFTGATMDRKGFFELADGGTLFLDEIGDMPLPLQAKLLRVIEDGCVTPVGASQAKKVNVRVVAATNANLVDQVPAGDFRQDLYFRLAQFIVNVPPLRNRKDDIPLLAEHFLSIFAGEMGMTPPALSSEALETLRTYAFPGNVRELKNIMERALIESSGDPIRAPHIHLSRFGTTTTVAALAADRNADVPSASRVAGVPPASSSAPAEEIPLNLEQAEAALIRRALNETKGNVAQAARLLGINRTRIYRRFPESRA